MQPALRVVTDALLAARISELRREIKGLATQQAAELVEALGVVERIASEVVAAGDAHPPGVRDICRKLAEESAGKAQSINAIMERKP